MPMMGHRWRGRDFRGENKPATRYSVTHLLGHIRYNKSDNYLFPYSDSYLVYEIKEIVLKVSNEIKKESQPLNFTVS